MSPESVAAGVINMHVVGQHDEVVAAMLHRLRTPSDWESFVHEGERLGWCERPIRLAGSTKRIDRGSGEIVSEFSSSEIPGGLLTTCKSKSCEHCGRLKSGDFWNRIMAGLVGGKGVPESVADHPMVAATWTAPSFGACHTSFREPRSCTARRGECKHGWARSCQLIHERDDQLVGAAICPECFDFVGMALFNAAFAELWRRTMIEVRRRLAALGGLSQRAAANVVRLSFVSVAELQKRGALHRHAYLRLDGISDWDDRLIPPPAPFDDPELLIAAIDLAAAKVCVPVNGAHLGHSESRWGRQIEAHEIRLHGAGNSDSIDLGAIRKMASYAAKYFLSPKPGDQMPPASDGTSFDRHEHLQRLMSTCEWLSRDPALTDLPSLSNLEGLGSNVRSSSASRRYSITMTALHEERIKYARRNAPPARQDVILEKDWRFQGSGWRSTGESIYARQRAGQRHDEARLAREFMRGGGDDD